MEVVPVDRVELVLDPEPWRFSAARRAEIDAHFAAIKRDKPGLWNGRLLMLGEYRLAGRSFVGRFHEADFATLLWCRDNDYPDRAIRNAFAMGVLVGNDGGYVLGRMASWTANGGRVYFAAGTPDFSDVRADGTVDLDGSLMREFSEETGLGADDVAADPGWHAVFAGPRIAFARRLLMPVGADAVAARVRANIAADPKAELEDAVVVRSPDDVSESMPEFVRGYLGATWGGRLGVAG